MFRMACKIYLFTVLRFYGGFCSCAVFCRGVGVMVAVPDQANFKLVGYVKAVLQF